MRNDSFKMSQIPKSPSEVIKALSDIEKQSNI